MAQHTGIISRRTALIAAACGCTVVAAGRMLFGDAGEIEALPIAYGPDDPHAMTVRRYYAEAGGAELVMDAVAV